MKSKSVNLMSKCKNHNKEVCEVSKIEGADINLGSVPKINDTLNNLTVNQIKLNAQTEIAAIDKEEGSSKAIKVKELSESDDSSNRSSKVSFSYFDLIGILLQLVALLMLIKFHKQ